MQKHNYLEVSFSPVALDYFSFNCQYFTITLSNTGMCIN